MFRASGAASAAPAASAAQPQIQPGKISKARLLALFGKYDDSKNFLALWPSEAKWLKKYIESAEFRQLPGDAFVSTSDFKTSDRSWKDISADYLREQSTSAKIFLEWQLGGYLNPHGKTFFGKEIASIALKDLIILDGYAFDCNELTELAEFNPASFLINPHTGENFSADAQKLLRKNVDQEKCAKKNKEHLENLANFKKILWEKYQQATKGEKTEALTEMMENVNLLIKLIRAHGSEKVNLSLAQRAGIFVKKNDYVQLPRQMKNELHLFVLTKILAEIPEWIKFLETPEMRVSKDDVCSMLGEVVTKVLDQGSSSPSAERRSSPPLHRGGSPAACSANLFPASPDFGPQGRQTPDDSSSAASGCAATTSAVAPAASSASAPASGLSMSQSGT